MSLYPLWDEEGERRDTGLGQRSPTLMLPRKQKRLDYSQYQESICLDHVTVRLSGSQECRKKKASASLQVQSLIRFFSTYDP